MKKNKLFLLAISLFLFSCGGDNSSTNSDSEESITLNASTLSSIPEKQDACETISAEKIAEIMGWPEAKTTCNNDFSTEKYRFTLGRYMYVPDGEEAKMVSVRMEWANDKIIERKTIEKRFKTLLEVGEIPMKKEEWKITYKELEGGENQLIYGQGDTRFSKKTYLLRFRQGLEFEVLVEATSETGKDEEMLGKFQQILGEIRN